MTDRARRVGWGMGGPGVRCSRTHPLQPPRGFRGPLRWFCLRLACSGPLVLDPGITLPVPTQYTHPVYPPGTHQTLTRCSLPAVQ